MSVRAFTSSLSHTIIERVRDHPEIWQVTHPLYKRRVVHSQFWEELSAELSVNDKVLKKRWKALKDQYRKEHKRAMETNEQNVVNWQYFDALKFLREEFIHRDRERAVAAAIDADSSEADSDDEVAPPSKTHNRMPIFKKKRQDSPMLNAIFKRLTATKNLLSRKFNEVDNSRNDPDCMYLLSLLPSMKQLTDIQKLQFRGKINSWLLEALSGEEMAEEPEKEEYASVTVSDVNIKCESE